MLVGLWVEIVLESCRTIVEWGISVPLFVCLDSKCTQMLANHIQAGDGESFETKSLVTPEQGIQELGPSLVDFRPNQIR